MEPLREYLLDALPPEPIELDENEIITDAVVLFRVVDVSGEGMERYRYTTTSGMSLGMAGGIIRIGDVILKHHLWGLAEDDEDE